MELMRTVGAITIATALAGGFPVNSAFADLPQKPFNVKVMDTNNNNRIERTEYVAFMGAEFDKIAGGKGYCTYKEVATGLRQMGSAIPDQSGVTD